MNQEQKLQKIEKKVRSKLVNGVYKESDIDLSSEYLRRLPNLSDIPTVRLFKVDDNLLTHLVGAPNTVDIVSADYNKINTLIGSPQHIKVLRIVDNQLESFEGISPEIESVYATLNPLKSFKGLPNKLKFFAFSILDTECSYEHFPSSIDQLIVKKRTACRLEDGLKIVKAAVQGAQNADPVFTKPKSIHNQIAELLRILFSKQ